MPAHTSRVCFKAQINVLIVLNTDKQYFELSKQMLHWCMLQGCQIPDFSLRSQTFYYTADFFITFFIYTQNQDFFAHPITKPPASTLAFKNFDSILQRNSVISDKNGKSIPTQLAPPVPGQAYGPG